MVDDLKTSRLNEFDKEVARNLARFRKIRRISRAAFAVSIGIGTERLAAYENARNPLKYFVFRRISKEYGLSPLRLVGDNSHRKVWYPSDEDAYIHEISETATFQEVYLKYIANFKDDGLHDPMMYLEGDLDDYFMQATRAVRTGQCDLKTVLSQFREIKRAIQKCSKTLPPLKLKASNA